MASTQSRPWVSFVVEWENALLSDRNRSVTMLRTMRRQCVEVASSPEVTSRATFGLSLFELLVVYDEARLDGGHLAEMLRRCVGDSDEILHWRLLPTRESGYYKNKNFGAREAAGEVLLFVDADVIPEAGWLRQVLSGLADHPAVEVMAGSAYIEPEGLVGKVFALTWFFPLRTKDGPLQRVDSFFVNTLAIRSSFHRQHPFPDLDGTSRGSCIVLANELAAAGIPVYLNPRVRVRHPAPNGIRHISKRALAQGRDRLYRERRFGTRWSSSWLASCLRLARHDVGSAGKTLTGFHSVGLNPLLIPAALMVAWYYYLLYWTGEILTHLRVPAIHKVRV